MILILIFILNIKGTHIIVNNKYWQIKIIKVGMAQAKILSN